MSKLTLYFTEQPVSIMFCGRELFHIFFSLIGFESITFYTLQAISDSWFWFWLFGLLPENYIVQYDITQQKYVWRQIFLFLRSSLAEVGLLCVCISPNVFIFLMNIFSGWTGKLQTRHPVVFSQPVLWLDWKNPGLLLNHSGSTDQLLCSTVIPNK